MTCCVWYVSMAGRLISSQKRTSHFDALVGDMTRPLGVRTTLQWWLSVSSSSLGVVVEEKLSVTRSKSGSERSTEVSVIDLPEPGGPHSSREDTEGRWPMIRHPLTDHIRMSCRVDRINHHIRSHHLVCIQLDAVHPAPPTSPTAGCPPAPPSPAAHLSSAPAAAALGGHMAISSSQKRSRSRSDRLPPNDHSTANTR